MAECFNAESATKRFENLETCVKNWIEGYALSSKKFSLLDSNKKLSNILNLLSFQIKEGVIDVMAIMRLALSEENLRKLSLMDSFKNALTQLQSKYSKGGERCKFQQTLNNLCAKATDPEVSLQEVLNEIKTSLGKNASAILASDPLHAALTLLLKQVEEGVINQERILASIPVSAASSTGMFSATSSTPSVGNLEPAETSQLTVSLQSTLFVMCSSLSDFFINLDIMFNHSENRDLSNTLAGIAGNLRLYVGEFDLESRIKKMKWMAEAVVQVRGECLCQPTRDAKEPRARLLATMIELSAQIHQGILDFDKLNDIAQHGAEKYNKPQNNKRWNPFGK